MNKENQNSEFARQVNGIYEQLSQESERGSAIIGAAYIDDVLEEILKAFMIAPAQRQDELFASSFAPLGSLSAKIALSYRLGLISPNIRVSLDLVRKIRNDFAHVLHPIDFKTQSVHDRIRELFNLNNQLLDSIWEIAKGSLVGLELETKSMHGLDNLVEAIGWKSSYDIVISIIAATLYESIKNVPQIISHHRD